MSHLVDTSATVVAALDAAIFGERYAVVRPLRVGNGVNTYLAVDVETGGSVVVKAIDHTVVNANVRIRFEHETQVLQRLTGLGLGRLVDAGHVDDRLFLVQEFVPGQTLAKVLESGPLPVDVVARIGRDVATALHIAHGANICHRDVKPANIIIGGTNSIETATLIDFGFARSPKLDESIRDELVGTVRYLAPESSGLLASPADQRSDLYALGVVMFECLAGRPVFLGETVSDLLRDHLSTPAPELRSLGIPVPRAVDDMIQRLLRKDPAERYQSAEALAADLDDLSSELAAGHTEPRLVIGRRDRRSTLTDPSFIGRHDEVAELASVITGLRSGMGGIVTLQADSGGGKSRLLNEISRSADELGVTVLHGQGVAQAAQRPFTLLHGVADDLVAIFATDPAGRDVLRNTLNDVSVAIVRALPALSALFATTAEQDSGPEQFGEVRSLLGLRSLLTTVATPERPVLIVLDDCQWADTLTVRLLSELFPNGPQDTYLTVVAAFRTEEVPDHHPLRHLPSRDITLGPLPADALAMLAESMAGPLPPMIVDTIVRLAEGNPFMGAAVMRGLVESGALVSDDDGWTVDVDKVRDVQAARQSALFLVSRLELLSTSALELLSAGAVLGKHFDVATAIAIVQADSNEADAIIGDASRRRLLWIDEAGGQCRFFHDKIRETLLDRLADETRRHLHSRAADALIGGRTEASDDDSVFDIAYHLDAGGRGAEALPYAVLAAGLARSRYALDAAASYYRMAAAVCPARDINLRADLAEGLGDVLTLQGIYGEAEASLQEARELVQDRTRGAEVDGKLGALAFKQGDIPTAKAHLEGALERLGRRIPRRSSTQVLRLLWELVVQAGHTLAPKLFVARHALGREDERLAMVLHSRLAYLYWFHSGKILCGWTHLRGLNLAERFEPSAELGQAYSEHAPVMTMLPWYSRGIRYARRSHEIRAADGDVWGQGQSLGFAGVVHYAASQYELAKQACIDAIALLRRTGDQWEVNTATWNLALSHLRLGNLDESSRIASDLFAGASRIGDQTSAGIALSVWTRAVLGRVDGDLISQQLAKAGEDTQTKAELLLALALFQRNAGDLAAAADSITAGVELVAEAGLRQEYVAPLFAWRATILREIAEQTSTYSAALRRSRLRDSRKAARRARRWALSYRNNGPHALRESALIAALDGKQRRATRLLHRSIAMADQHGARFEGAQSELALAQVTAQGSTPVSAIEARRTDVESFLAGSTYSDRADRPDAEPTISLIDRFASLLTVGRAITAAPSYRPLQDAIREATLSLLRPERCHLIPVGALLHDPLTTDSGSELHAASRTLIAEAVRVGSAVVAIDDADPNESLLLSGVRSALAAPIFVQGEAVSCIYVTHRQVGKLFGEEEIQLADFIATIAGAAFEHLLGNETRFRSLAQNSSDVISLLNHAGVVTYQSPAVGRVFGLPIDGILGEPIAGWLHPDDLAEFEDAIAAAQPGHDVRIEHRVRHADGSYRDAETILTNLLDEPTIGALVLNTRDVTDRKQIEEQLRQRNVELERASRAKDMFLATMSHELRTPLNAIIGFTGVLLMKLPGPLNDDQAGQLRTVEQSGRHLLTIINDILDVARIESGTVQLQLENIDCVAAVEHVTSTLSPLAAEKGLELHASTPTVPVLVQADARAIGQILVNLVGNAVKFTETGRVSVTVAPAARGRVAISVADTGGGIPAADLDAIFEAFERGTGVVQNRKEGTGLGLYVSHKMAELMGAELTVQSRLEVGTTFTLTLDEGR